MADVDDGDPMRAAALAYAKARWPVLPLDAALAPIEHEPTTDPTTIVLWWGRYAGARPGVVLGRPIGGSRQHLVALIDHGGAPATDYLQKRGALDALGLGQIIHGLGRERAWLFASPEPMPSRELAPGLVVRGDGIVALPPSEDAEGVWRWRKGGFLPDRAMIAAPHWLRVAEPAPARAPDEPAVSHEWVDELARTKTGAVVPSLANAALILRCDERWAGRIAYDEMALAVVRDGRTMGDADVAAMREQLERRYAAQFADRTMRDALLVVGEARRFHPVRAYLAGLRWDGVARIDAVAGQVLRVQPADEPLARRMVRAFFVSAVARARRPGCQVDTCLVLYSREQGMFKSRFFRTLAEPWFSDTLLDPTNKDSLQQIAAAWIYELGEVDSITSRKHASDLKRFMTSSTDTFRPPYERTVRTVPRSGVLVGTTNKDRFLTDETGSRRFWIARVGGRIDIARVARERDQLWAEAVVAFERGESWWLSSDDEAARETDAEHHIEQDPWRVLLVRYFQARFRSRELRAEYTAQELALDVLKLERKELDKPREMRIGDILRGLGFQRRKLRIERDGRRLDPTWTWMFPEGETAPEWITTERADGEEGSDDAPN